MKKYIITACILIASIFAWHLYHYYRLSTAFHYMGIVQQTESYGFDVDINPISNFVSLNMFLEPMEYDENDPYSALGTILGEAIGKAYVENLGPQILERRFRMYSHQNYDLYSMLIPYKVEIAFNSEGGQQ